jgi:hypothetical protein
MLLVLLELLQVEVPLETILELKQALKCPIPIVPVNYCEGVILREHYALDSILRIC